ncbi:ribosomal RNA small subunit methyltransferase E [Bacteroidia bacterium]|nr:ribosomal RNA small subunit methyltransferase E [Bacteroidia bacterium]
MHLFFISVVDSQIILSEEDSYHCAKVLRLSVGDTVRISDGRGTIGDAVLTQVSARQCTAQVTQSTHITRHAHYIHIAIAPTKNIDRFEWFLEKATELGVDEITPIFTAHSERKTIKHDRSLRVVEAASKQAQVAYIPKLNEAVSFEQFVEQSCFQNGFIGYCGNEFDKIPLVERMKASSGDSALILIGPEGDFSATEVQNAVIKGAKVIGLGTTRLRTETAAIAAVITTNVVKGQ